MQLIDLSQTITPEMPLFSPTWPKPEVKAWLSHAQAAVSGRYEDCSCEISAVSFITSLGTYMDSPYHFNPAGAKIEQLNLAQLVLPGVVVDCTRFGARQPIGAEVLEGVDVAGKAVLFHTGWSRHWGQPAYFEFPFLSAEVALALRERGAKLAGVDFLAADDVTNPRRPAHVTLLHAEILIVENLTNLAALPPVMGGLPAASFTFHAAPAKIAGAASFPVRAYAVMG